MLSQLLLISKWSSTEDQQQYRAYCEQVKFSLEQLLEFLDPAQHAPILELINELLVRYAQLKEESLKKRQECLILYREAFLFLKLYLFKPEQVKYYLEHDLNQTYFLKQILN